MRSSPSTSERHARAPLWLEPVETPQLWLEPACQALALDVVSADSVRRINLSAPDEAALGLPESELGQRRAPAWRAFGALQFRSYDLPTGPAGCPQSAPLAQHHRVISGVQGAARTSLVLARPGDAFTVSGVRATTGVDEADELLFEVDSDGGGDLVLRIDAGLGCLRGPGKEGLSLAPLSVTVGDVEGEVFGAVDVEAPPPERLHRAYGTSTAWVTIPEERLPAGRHTLHLRVTGGRAAHRPRSLDGRRRDDLRIFDLRRSRIRTAREVKVRPSDPEGSLRPRVPRRRR